MRRYWKNFTECEHLELKKNPLKVQGNAGPEPQRCNGGWVRCSEPPSHAAVRIRERSILFHAVCCIFLNLFPIRWMLSCESVNYFICFILVCTLHKIFACNRHLVFMRLVSIVHLRLKIKMKVYWFQQYMIYIIV